MVLLAVGFGLCGYYISQTSKARRITKFLSSRSAIVEERNGKLARVDFGVAPFDASRMQFVADVDTIREIAIRDSTFTDEQLLQLARVATLDSLLLDSTAVSANGVERFTVQSPATQVTIVIDGKWLSAIEKSNQRSEAIKCLKRTRVAVRGSFYPKPEWPPKWYIVAPDDNYGKDRMPPADALLVEVISPQSLPTQSTGLFVCGHLGYIRRVFNGDECGSYCLRSAVLLTE